VGEKGCPRTTVKEPKREGKKNGLLDMWISSRKVRSSTQKGTSEDVRRRDKRKALISKNFKNGRGKEQRPTVGNDFFWGERTERSSETNPQ